MKRKAIYRLRVTRREMLYVGDEFDHTLMSAKASLTMGQSNLTGASSREKHEELDSDTINHA